MGALGPDETTLQLFCWHGEGRFVFIGSSGGTCDLVRDQPISETTLELIRDQYQHLIEHGTVERRWDKARAADSVPGPVGSVRSLGQLVQRLVLHPDFRALLADDSYSEIVISTNEFSIPWEAIANGNSFLGLQRPLTRRLQSLRPLAHTTRILYRSTLRVLIAADPTGDLPGTAYEAEQIENLLLKRAERFDVRRLTGSECTRLELLPLLAEADIFHYAGHAYFDTERPKESGLILHDGQLFASEIENYLDRQSPSLVFLNACQSTAFADASVVVSGQTMAGLAHPFISSGSEAVIGAALPVPDRQAADFATHLYTGLVTGDSLAVSMWRARCALVDAHGIEDPCWTSFLLFGNGALRVVVEGREHSPTQSAVRTAIESALSWFEREREDCGNWCDRVYRSEGAMNTAEVLLAYMAAERAPATALLHTSIQRLLNARESGYSAAPYEPAHLGTFTSCVAHVLLALVGTLKSGWLKTRKSAIADAIADAGTTLLLLQGRNGGWSWGEMRGESIPEYTLFTVEALQALDAWSQSGIRVDSRAADAVDRGCEYLKATQQADGGWAYKSSVNRSDPTSTCYVMGRLLDRGASLSDPTISHALAYLRQQVDFGDIRHDQFYLDHRIEIPGAPQSTWPHFEDYGGLGGLLDILALAPEAEQHLGTSGLLNALVARILESQEEQRGWPQIYSTIYATAYFVDVLAAALPLLPDGQ